MFNPSGVLGSKHAVITPFDSDCGSMPACFCGVDPRSTSHLDACHVALIMAILVTNVLFGRTAVWLWLSAPTQHLLLAARFLMLNGFAVSVWGSWFILEVDTSH